MSKKIIATNPVAKHNYNIITNKWQLSLLCPNNCRTVRMRNIGGGHRKVPKNRCF